MTIQITGFSITEPTNIIALAPASAQTIYVASNSITYFTSSATTNWTANVTYSTTQSLNSAMNVGDTISIVVMTTQGTTAYYESVMQIDGVNQTPKWQGGTAPSKGNASGVDVYTYTILKTAATPTYTVLASQTQFA